MNCSHRKLTSYTESCAMGCHKFILPCEGCKKIISNVAVYTCCINGKTYHEECFNLSPDSDIIEKNISFPFMNGDQKI